MSATVRLFFAACCSLAPLSSSMAETEPGPVSALERALASCGGNQQCEATIRNREALAAEKRQRREAADKKLKDADPVGYYLSLSGRYLLAIAFIGGAAGLYVLVMHRLFGKAKRRPPARPESR